MSFIRDLFRPPTRPAQNTTPQAQPQAAAAAPAGGTTNQVAQAPAPAAAQPPAQPQANQVAQAPRAQSSFLSDLFDTKPATTTQAQPSSGFGHTIDNWLTDLFGHAKHRHPTDRTNFSQWAADHFGEPIPVSSNDDDPFAKASNIEAMKRTDFDVDKNGNPVGLSGNRAKVQDEDKIFRRDPRDGQYKPFAWNPWPSVKPDANGKFVFDEPRFPPFQVERGPDGKPILKDGLQVWTPNNLKVGSATAFEAMNSASRASESWAGREIDWGQNGKLETNAHAFIDFNAFYSPSAKGLFFGVVPYRLPGETQVKLFETATSWEMVAHESGHAIHHALKPNVDLTDIGFGQWGESFADQTAMWGSLKDRGRVEDLLKEIDGNLNQSNSLTRMGEAFAALTGQGTGVRDALQDKTMSTTSPEVHDRSEVLTGASYKIFQSVYQDQLAHGRSREDAMQVAGDVMGTMNLRATEHTPENQLTFEDVGKGWLKVDKEYFHGKYHDVIANELKRREVFTDQSVKDFDAHEAALPKLSMGIHKNDDALNSLINKNLGKLGIGPGFGLKVLSHELDDNGAQIVRVQLTDKSGKKAVDLDNHGVLTFRPDGSLMDWQSPVPKGATTADLAPVLAAARAAGLDQHGAPVGVRRGDDGQLTAAARAMPTGNMNSTVTTWSLANPDGQVHDITRIPDLDEMAAALPKGAVVLSPDEIANLSPEDLAAGDQPATGPKLDGTASLFVAPPPPPPAVPADTTTQGG